MNQYITGAMIRRLREEQGMTQLQLAEKLNVSDKSISKWENAHGYPDISLIEPLAAALGVSVIELLSGENVVNTNRQFNMLRGKFYVCPICGNVIFSMGESVVSCHGIRLYALEAEEPDEMHTAITEKVEDEYYITFPHEMSKGHYISFAAVVRDSGCEMVKLYPEGDAAVRFKISRARYLYYCCNRHGFYKVKLR